MKAKKLSSLRKWFTIGLFAKSGDGKTSLAATSPRPIFLDSNKGTSAVAERKGLEHVRGVDIESMADLEAAYDNCKGVGDQDWSKTGKNYQTVIVDHFDDMQNIVLEELLEKDLEKDPDREDVIEQREWGIMFSKLRRWVRKFKTVPMHKILIMGATEDSEGRLVPSLSGQMKDKLPYMLDHTIFLRRNEKTGVRYVHLDPTEDFYAKTRASHLSAKQRKIRVDFDNPHMMTDIIELLRGSKGE